MGKNMSTSILDATKIQARIVIPIVKALEKELGKENFNKIPENPSPDHEVIFVQDPS